jgi:hypothetical protein
MRIAFARRLLPVTLALVGVLSIGACGDDDSVGSAAKPRAQPQALPVEVTEQSKDEFSMTAPKSVKAGIVEISLKAPAGKGTHDAQLVRVEGDHEIEEVLKSSARRPRPRSGCSSPAAWARRRAARQRR